MGLKLLLPMQHNSRTTAPEDMDLLVHVSDAFLKPRAQLRCLPPIPAGVLPGACVQHAPIFRSSHRPRHLHGVRLPAACAPVLLRPRIQDLAAPHKCDARVRSRWRACHAWECADAAHALGCGGGLAKCSPPWDL